MRRSLALYYLCLFALRKSILSRLSDSVLVWNSAAKSQKLVNEFPVIPQYAGRMHETLNSI